MNSSTSIVALEKRLVAEFFAGIGLMRMGLEKAGWSVRFANDIAPEKESMYRLQFPDAADHFILGDVHKLSSEQLPSVGLATASFPCTDLSLAGMREGLKGKHSSAFWGFVNALENWGDRRPPLILLENVAGFLTSHQGRDLEEALLALNQLGYSVDLVVLDAERFVPQSRVRLFVVGELEIRKDQLQVAETPGFYESRVRPRAVADYIFSHPNIRWNFRPLPPPPIRTRTLADIIEKVPDSDPIWWNADRTQYLLSQLSPKHASSLETLKTKRSWSYSTAFRRVRHGKSMAELRTDNIAGCLRTPKGGSARQILLQAGHGVVKVRLLTPRECARLMGADDYKIETSLNHALFGFGDAVCVPVVEWLSRNYLNPLAEEWSRDVKGLEFFTNRKSA